jgi:tetratricopeptide (TPR) repeat protein
MAISYSHSDIGFLLRGEKKLQEALEHYRKTVKIREELAEVDPNNARATMSLVSAYWRTASAAIEAGDIENALDLLKKAVKTLAQSKNPDPGSVRSRTELAQVYAVYGKSYAAVGDAGEARDWFGRSKQICTGLRGSGKLNADGADLLQSVEEELAKLGKTQARAHRAPAVP